MTAELLTLLKNRISLIWLVLIAATLISWWIGTGDAASPQLGTAAVFVVVFIKVRLVGLYFMELRDAPLPLRLLFEGYCLIVCTTLLVMYLAAGAS
jgi:heme/copper-type cytochrome/quinol oxidase subunit 4